MKNQILEDNAPRIRADIILEIANGAISSKTDEILEDRGVTVIPDVLVNAGDVAVSYFEWIQNRAGYYWEEDEINQKLKSLMQKLV